MCEDIQTEVRQFDVPQQFLLHQNYPNPFNPTTTISYAPPIDANVSIAVYNTLGQKVAQLVEERMTAGYHDMVFDASQLASGLYFYRLTAVADNGAHFTQARKLMVIK